MALLHNLPKELSLIIDFYSNPIQCFHCEKMSFMIKGYAYNPAYKKCYDCLSKCACDIYCVYLCNFDSIQYYNNYKIYHNINHYFPGTKCYYCDEILCMYCVNKIDITRYAVYSIYSCKNCLRKCKQCSEIINKYHCYEDVNHNNRCSSCDDIIDFPTTHCRKYDICTPCTMPPLEETL